MKKSSFILGCDGKIDGVKRILSAIFSIFLFLSFVTPSFAASSCQLLLDKTTYRAGEIMRVAATNIILDDNQVTNNEAGVFEIVRPASFNGTMLDLPVPVPGGLIQNSILDVMSIGEAAGSGEQRITLRYAGGPTKTICSTTITVTAEPESNANYCDAGAITIQPSSGRDLVAGQPITIRLNANRTHFVTGVYSLNLLKDGNYFDKLAEPQVFDVRGLAPLRNGIDYEETFASLQAGSYAVNVEGTNGSSEQYCVTPFTVCTPDDVGSSCSAVIGAPVIPIADFNYCDQVPAGVQRDACEQCVGTGEGPTDSNKTYTAVGCIDTTQEGLAANLIQLLLGISGGVALLSVLAGAFIFSTSQGESGRVKQAKELITAAVTGLLFIIFSIIILDFIGVKILQIPGLG